MNIIFNTITYIGNFFKNKQKILLKSSKGGIVDALGCPGRPETDARCGRFQMSGYPGRAELYRSGDRKYRLLI